MSHPVVTATLHQAGVVELPGRRYPFLPSCSCGELFWGYVSRPAAEGLVEAHLVEAAAAPVPLGACTSCGSDLEACWAHELTSCCSACLHPAA